MSDEKKIVREEMSFRIKNKNRHRIRISVKIKINTVLQDLIVKKKK